MHIEEELMVSSDGKELFGRSWLPDGDITPEAILCVVHGLSEHSGRYESLADFFTDRNIAVFSFDLRGHGKTSGKRGHVKNYDLLLDDVECLAKIARREYNETPIFLYGQSLGGNIVASYITRKNTSEISGAILSAPWLRLAFKPPAIKVKLAGMMKNIYPAYTEDSGIKADSLSRDPDVVKAYVSDPLVQKRISSSLFFEAVRSGEEALSNAFKTTIPVLGLHGLADQLTSPDATKDFINKIENATFNGYDDVLHEPHNDLDKDKVMGDILDWIHGLIK